MKETLDSLFEANQLKRLEHAKDPESYFESEGDLHAFLKEMQSVAAFPEKIALFLGAGCVESLLAILDH
jgi:hypothetical protein